ncbi:MAG: cytochrome c [Acidobacteria bacterium]|nr:cytochrome c [Acidobacteriota bacterium]
MKALLPFLLVTATTIGGLWLSRSPGSPPAPSESLPWTPPLNRTQETGRRIYLRRCAWCHGQQRDGYGTNAPRLAIAPPDFTTDDFRRAHSKSVLIDWLDHPRPRPAWLCPNWGATLTPPERNAVAEYVLSRDINGEAK